jgi:hypothetical protein
LDESTWQKNQILTEVKPGFHSVFVKDLYGCETVIDNILVGVEQFNSQLTITPDNDCLEGTGTINIEVMENNGPYQFKLDSFNFTADNFFENLQKGEHFLSVQDKDNCIVTMSVSIPHGTTGISWQNEILPIMQTACALSGCHDGVTRLDWRNYDNVKQYAAAIKENTQNKSMPFDSTLPQEDIDKIACWVDDGALKN